jgi:tRNA 2-thiouridine synthesizing protein E
MTSMQSPPESQPVPHGVSHAFPQAVLFARNNFLANFDDWNHDVAKEIAAADGIVLTEDHWHVIRFIRDYYRTHSIPPSGRVVVKSAPQMLDPYGPFTRRHLQALFPLGGCRQACRIAGLPDYYQIGC